MLVSGPIQWPGAEIRDWWGHDGTSWELSWPSVWANAVMLAAQANRSPFIHGIGDTSAARCTHRLCQSFILPQRGGSWALCACSSRTDGWSIHTPESNTRYWGFLFGWRIRRWRRGSRDRCRGVLPTTLSYNVCPKHPNWCVHSSRWKNSEWKCCHFSYCCEWLGGGTAEQWD